MRSAAILLLAGVATAQTPAFEVASVKLYAPAVRPGVRFLARADADPSQFQISGTRVEARGNLMSLVAGAYGLERYQVSQSGEWTEKWATGEVYAIEARAPGDAVPSVAQVRQMIQTLLAERFQLKFRRETAPLPIYQLVVAPGGPKFKATEFADDPPRTRDEGSMGAQIRTRFLNYSVAEFIRVIYRQLDRPLIDQTGLAGGYDFSLAYTARAPGLTPETAAALGLGELEPGQPIVASIREQLGLRVVAAKGPLEMLTIERAERPSAN